MPYADETVRRDYYKEWRQKNKEYLLQKNREWRKKNKVYANRMASLYHRRQMRLARHELASQLGGKCQRCGYPDERAFEFHHANGDGKDHRLRWGHVARYYRELLSESIKKPGSIVLLCANCHCIEHWVSDDDYTPLPPDRRRRFTQEDRASIKSRHASGESVRSICRSLNASRNAIAGIVRS